MGGNVAREQYAVGAHPTSFWLDANGTIIDYVIGFDPGDERHIELRIQLTPKRKSVPVSIGADCTIFRGNVRRLLRNAHLRTVYFSVYLVRAR